MHTNHLLGLSRLFARRRRAAAGALLTLLALLSSAAARAQFGAVTTYSTGAGSLPRSLAVGYANGDQRLDIVTLLGGSNAVGVLPGQAGGTFATLATYPLGAGAHTAVVLADVNLDGWHDIVTTNNAGSTVEVLLSQAGAGFGAFTAYSTGPNSFPQGLAVADVNNDGRPDIITANTDANTLGVLLNQAGGGFAPAALYNTGAGSQPGAVVVRDVNGDGRFDLIATNSGTHTVGVLLGQAGGSFAAAATYSTGAGSFPQGLAVADVSNDGRPDIITANQDGNSLSVLLNQGGGGFAAAGQYGTGADSAPRQVAVGDVNGDGRPDLVTANSAALHDKVGVLLGLGGGTFGPVTLYGTGLGSAPRSVALADVSGDGRPDIITVHPGTYGIPPDLNALVGGDAVGVLLNAGTFTVATAAARSAPAVTLYPNPARGSCTLRCPAGAAGPALLLNSLGQAVRRWTLAAGETTVDLRGLAPGVYTLRLNDQPAARRLVLE